MSLNLTKADIRYHIKKLLDDNRIHKIPSEAGIRGRPAIRYKVANSYFSNNLITLINAIFSTIQFKDNDISKIAEHISSLIAPERPQSLITKFNTLIIGLNKQNYSARWETQFKGPVIFFSNCPYRQVAQDHPVICEIDKRIIEIFLNKNVSVINTIVINGTSYCKFQILV